MTQKTWLKEPQSSLSAWSYKWKVWMLRSSRTVPYSHRLPLQTLPTCQYQCVQSLNVLTAIAMLNKASYIVEPKTFSE